MKTTLDHKGTLYIVGTPIGNLSDITLRAIDTLKKVDVILAEDTRQTLKLLNHFQIEKHLICYHRHNEVEKIDMVVQLLDSGKDLALVSDAGMPVISDPGQNLIQYLITNHYPVVTIPGVTAVTTAIVQSGIDSTRFIFEGFLSVNKKQRKEKLAALVNETRTIIFYEAPHKLLATLKDLMSVLGDRQICIARELTKIHEEYRNTTLKEAIQTVETEGIRGEIVLIVEGMKQSVLDEKKQEEWNQLDTQELVKKYMNAGETKMEAIKKVAKLKGVNKNDIYKECIEL